MFLNKYAMDAEGITDSDFDRLARLQLNGRQVKSAVTCEPSLVL